MMYLPQRCFMYLYVHADYVSLFSCVLCTGLQDPLLSFSIKKCDRLRENGSPWLWISFGLSAARPVRELNLAAVFHV